MVDFKTIKKYCINLPEASQRRKRVEAEFARMGLDVEFVDGVSDEDGLRGCTKSHLKVLQMAANLDHVCIFEDDVAFADDFNERVVLPDDFDMFYLGSHSLSFNYKKTQHKNIYTCIRRGGTYAIIYSNKAIRYLLKNMTEDGNADRFVGNITGLNIICQLPFAVYTNDSYSFINKAASGIGNSMWQYEPKWNVEDEYVIRETIIENRSLYEMA